MSRLKIDQYYFDNEEYVLINLAVGAHKRPGRYIMKACVTFREESRLCEMLRRKGIKHDIMPVLVDSFEAAPERVDVEALRAEIEDSKYEAMRCTEELRDEVRSAGVEISGGPQPCDFGLDQPQIEIKMGVPEIPEWELTSTEGPEEWTISMESPFAKSPFDEPKPWAVRVNEDVEKEALDDVLDSFLKK